MSEKKPGPIPAALPEIADDEIWTYRIEGLQAPHITRKHTHSPRRKALVILVLLLSIAMSIFFSVKAVHKDTFQYDRLSDGTYTLVKFNNPGDRTTLTIDCADDDETKPITALSAFMLNCDDKLLTVTIGPHVASIDGASFYSCQRLQAIFVDENNPFFCDVDGVLYTKDLRCVICCPIDRDAYLREKYGYARELTQKDAGYAQYAADVLTYRLPPQTQTVGMLAFNYAAFETVELPEGVQTIETMAFFRCTALETIRTYRGDTTYPSLPDGLVTIGSDAFSYDQALTYMYIPDSVTSIGHHAFWDTVYKNSGALAGLTEICVQADEDTFRRNVQTGDQWRGEYDHLLFRKAVPILYGTARDNG